MNVAALRKYVAEHEGTEALPSLLPFWPINEKERVLFRGQHADDSEIRPVPFISTTKTKKVAAEEFAHDTCCVFVLHVMPGLHILDVNAVLGEHKHTDEQEVLVEVGEFYTTESKRTKGFAEAGTYLGRQVLEAWLFPAAKRKLISRKILEDRLPEEEVELYRGDSLASIVSMLTSTNAIKENEVLGEDAIAYVLGNVKGGGRRRRTRRLRRYR